MGTGVMEATITTAGGMELMLPVFPCCYFMVFTSNFTWGAVDM
jgi:hypothetical protein